MQKSKREKKSGIQNYVMDKWRFLFSISNYCRDLKSDGFTLKIQDKDV